MVTEMEYCIVVVASQEQFESIIPVLKRPDIVSTVFWSGSYFHIQVSTKVGHAIDSIYEECLSRKMFVRYQ